MSDKQVRFESQQRVDLPDLTNITSYSAAARRRGLAELFGGGDTVGRVLRGFDSVPEDPGVSARLLIERVESGVDGAFLSALFDGVTTEFGTIGGQGAAQHFLDFTGQPANTYEGKIRARLLAAAEDNRAFWNPASNTEFSKPTNVTQTPEWEVAFAGHAGSDWVALCDVVWNGAEIDIADITDKRDLLFEGVFPFGNAALASIPDFDRSVDRGSPLVTRGGIMQALHALQRQVAEMKGADDFGEFNTYARPAQAAGFVAAGFDAERHQRLDTIATATFTCSASTLHADFTGPTSLYDCLAHIEVNSNDLPKIITVVLKDEGGFGATPLYTFPAQISIAGKNLRIVAAGGGSGGDDQFEELTGIEEGKTLVEFDVASGTGILISDGSLHLENLRFEQLGGAALLSLTVGSHFSANNVTLRNGDMDTTDGAEFVLECTNSIRVENCWFIGKSRIAGRHPLDAGGAPGIDTVDQSQRGGYIDNCGFVGHVKFNAKNSPSSLNSAYEWSGNITVSRSTFQCLENATAERSREGMVNLMAARNIRFDDCQFMYHGDEDGVRVCSRVGSAVMPPKNIVFYNCEFILRYSATHVGANTDISNLVSPPGGVTETEGTGWALKITAVQDIVLTVQSNDEAPVGIRVLDCTFRVNRILSGFLNSSPDAGAIYCVDCLRTRIEGNDIIEWTEPPVELASSDAQIMILVAATTNGETWGLGREIKVLGNYVGAWQENTRSAIAGFALTSWGGTQVTGSESHVQLVFLVLYRTSTCRVAGNTWSTIDSTGESHIVTTLLGQAIIIQESTAVVIDNDSFLHMMPATEDGDSWAEVLLAPISSVGAVSNISIRNCTFLRSGCFEARDDFGGGTIAMLFIDSNDFILDPSVDNEGAPFLQLDVLSASHNTMSFCHNKSNYFGPATTNSVHFNNASSFIFIGNLMTTHTVKSDAHGDANSPNAPGWGDMALPMNDVLLYET